MKNKLMMYLAEIDKRDKLHLLEDYDNRVMREIRQFNYENGTTFDAADTFLDYLLDFDHELSMATDSYSEEKEA